MSAKARKESAKALPLARLRPPAFDTGKRVSNLGLRDHDRTIELALRFRLAAAPLLAPIEHPHPIPHRPDLKAPDAIQGLSGLSFHACLCVYLCWGAPLRDWAVCRVSPFGPTAATPRATTLDPNPWRHAKAPKAAANGNRVSREFCLIRAPS